MSKEEAISAAKSAVRIAVIVAIRRSFYLLFGVAIWILLCRLELVHPRYTDTGTVIVGAALFFLGLPTSILLRLDKLSESFIVESYPTMLLCGVAVVAINWMLIAAARALLAPGRRENSKTSADADRRG